MRASSKVWPSIAHSTIADFYHLPISRKISPFLLHSRKGSSKAASPFVLPSASDFARKNTSRPLFDRNAPALITQSPAPSWKYGDGANDGSSSKSFDHVEINPATRPFISNYKLLVSAIPRPISFVSTISKDGQHKNLAPFSYFQIVDHDPPIFVIGFSARPDRLKDTRRNLVETGECVISVVSEHMIEGVNATSLDVPYGVSEWALTGFQAAPSTTVRPERVADAIFSIEGKLLEMKSLSYHGELESGKPTGALAIIEGTRFWVRRDACNEASDEVDIERMRPLIGLGGILYGRVRETFEWPRRRLSDELRDTSSGLADILEAQKEATQSE